MPELHDLEHFAEWGPYSLYDPGYVLSWIFPERVQRYLITRKVAISDMRNLSTSFKRQPVRSTSLGPNSHIYTGNLLIA